MASQQPDDLSMKKDQKLPQPQAHHQQHHQHKQPHPQQHHPQQQQQQQQQPRRIDVIEGIKAQHHHFQAPLKRDRDNSPSIQAPPAKLAKVPGSSPDAVVRATASPRPRVSTGGGTVTGLVPMSTNQTKVKYNALLSVIEELGKDIRPTYSGNRVASERLKRSLVHARIVVRECMLECEKTSKS